MNQKKTNQPTNAPLNLSRSERRKMERKPKKSIPRQLAKGLFVTSTTLALLVTAGGGVGGAYAWNKYGSFIQESVTKGYSIAQNVKEEDFVTKSPTKVFDAKGKLLKTFKEYQYETPTFNQINPDFTKALVSAEDERFFEHHGVDLYGTIRGITTTLQGNGTQGGSTITQQLVRNVILEDSDVTIERKLVEQVVSQEIEKKLDKKEILRHYLNNVYFGNGNYGIAPASKYYFSKNQKDIQLHEAAMIIGITNNPSLFDPITKPENALKKRNRVLGKMLEVGTITQAQHDDAVKKPLGIKVTKHGIDNSVTEPALGYAIHRATEHLMEEHGFVFQYSFSDDKSRTEYKSRYHEEYLKIRQEILNGGYQIETSIDMDKQKKLEQTINRVMAPYWIKDPNTGFYQFQTAMTTIDNSTGEVVAIAGGRGEKGNVFNRGFQGVRQPGSTIKPVVAYTPAFEKGYSPESTMTDSYVKNGPKNYYDGYRGAVSLRYATEISINTVPYKLANELGGKAMIEKLAKMKFGNLTAQDSNPIIAVGGFTYGTTSVEMASAYGTIINQGVYKEPTNVRRIKDIVTNKIIFERKQEARKVYDSGASYLMVDTLKGVMRKGTGTRAQPTNYKNMIGKTGTTNADKDIWFVGGSPYYTTAVWTGYDTPRSLPYTQHWVASSLFKEWNEELHAGKKSTDFKRPDTVWKQNGRWVTSVKQVESGRANRMYLENLRKDNEKASQRERLSLEDYRIVHGLSKEEEDEREKNVREAFTDFADMPFAKLSEYKEQRKVLDDILPLIKKVKHQRAYDAFQLEWQNALNALDGKKQFFLDEIERKKREAEQKKRAEEEAIRLEEERRIQQEVERRLEEERIKKEEEQRLEEEKQAEEEAENPIEEETEPPLVEEDTLSSEDNPVEPEAVEADKPKKEQTVKPTQKPETEIKTEQDAEVE